MRKIALKNDIGYESINQMMQINATVLCALKLKLIVRLTKIYSLALGSIAVDL